MAGRVAEARRALAKAGGHLGDDGQGHSAPAVREMGGKGRRTLDAFLVRRGGGEKPALARIGVEAGGGILAMEGAGGHEKEKIGRAHV